MVEGHAAGKSALIYLAVALFFLLITVGPLGAQVQTAAISGTATDASGAVLAGAQIQATNQTTNAAQSATTDAQGRYRLSDLPVGTYNLKATHTGFQTVVHKDVTLAVGSAIIMDFSLPVGKATETVSVDAEVSRVETETSEISALIAPVQMRELPLNGRNFEQLIALTPGVATVSSQTNMANFVVGRMYGAQDNYSVAGMRPTGQAFLLDGTDIRDFWEHGTGSGYAGTSLGVEAIGEFQMLTSNYNAQFSGNGVVMNATSRSGSNDWHGGFYEYFRNNHLDASSLGDRDAVLIAKENGVAVPSSPPPFKQNQFGVAIGGPIKKDKAFFFANWEGLRNQLVTNIAPVYMPMPYEYNGQAPCSLLPTYTAGCNGGVSNVAARANPSAFIPGSAANPLVTVPANANTPQMLNILKLYQLCTTCGPAPAVGSALDQGGWYTTSESPAVNTNEDYIMGRFDYTLGPKDSAFVRYTFDDARVADGMRDPTGIFPETDITHNQYLTITERRIVSTTTVNSLRFGFTRTREESSTPFHLTSAQLSKLGLSADPLDLVATSGYSDAAQRLDASLGAAPLEIGGIGFPELGPDPDRPLNQLQNKFSGGDDLLSTQGKHSLAIGAVVQRVQTNGNQLAYASGQDFIGWTPDFTNNFDTLMSFMQGTASWAYIVPPGYANGSRYFREIGVAPYIQDNWKMSSRLTLNIGIRYDYFTNPVGWAGGNQPLTAVTASYLAPVGPMATAPNCSALQTAVNNAVTAGQSVSTAALAACKLGIFVPVNHVFANNPNAQNWEPRIGFAYDVFGDHKTSLRGGFGIFHDPVSARIYSSGFGSEPPSSSFQFNNFFGNPVNNMCFPDPFKVVPGVCGVTSPSPGEFAAVDYQVQNGSPYVMQYNLNAQRQLPGNLLLTVGYVGSLGRHLWMQRDENPPVCTTYPNCSGIPTPGDPNSGANFAAGAAKINPNFGARVIEATTAASSYNGLQVTLSRQFSKTFSGQANYTWSKCIDDGSFATSLEQWGQLMTDPYNEKYDYGNCNFDIRHNLSANGVYSLPFKGNRAVAGWQVSTIVSFNTGMPLNVANGLFTDPSHLGGQWGTRPNYSGAAGCSPNATTGEMVNTGTAQDPYYAYEWLPIPVVGGVTQYGNLTCYTAQASGYLGNVARNSIQGPHFFNADFSVMKNTKLTEKLSMQFRAEFFNILNHFNPSGVGINTTLGGTGNVPTGDGVLQANNPRQVQFALKFDF